MTIERGYCDGGWTSYWTEERRRAKGEKGKSTGIQTKSGFCPCAIPRGVVEAHHQNAPRRACKGRHEARGDAKATQKGQRDTEGTKKDGHRPDHSRPQQTTSRSFLTCSVLSLLFLDPVLVPDALAQSTGACSVENGQGRSLRGWWGSLLGVNRTKVYERATSCEKSGV